jgi:hypothetical protein
MAGGSAASTQAKEAKMNRWTLLLVMLLSVSFVLLPGFSAAGEKMTGRIALHNIKVETIEVGDVPGHILGIAQQTGLTFYSTGEIARKINAASFDFVNGKGTFVEYSNYIDQDGSTLFTKGGGTSTPVDGGKGSAIEGTFECIGGTGRYEGFKGTGTYKGGRIGELKTGGDLYLDFTMNCRKP